LPKKRCYSERLGQNSTRWLDHNLAPVVLIRNPFSFSKPASFICQLTLLKEQRNADKRG